MQEFVITRTFDAPRDLPDLYTDEGKLTQILRNLISNALKFTEEGSVTVTARFEPEVGLIRFGVRDTGIGIAAEDCQKIFEEFSQIETRLHKKTIGTGLGLPLSRSLAQLLGGALTVESVLGQGSLFTLTLPARLGDAARVARSASGSSIRRQAPALFA